MLQNIMRRGEDLTKIGYPYELVHLDKLMKLSAGSPRITIGLIDGPVDLDHPSFAKLDIRACDISYIDSCRKSSSIACSHGTFIAGILSARRDGEINGICPLCRILLRPIFSEDAYLPISSPAELSSAIMETVDAGANIINLSLGISSSSLTIYGKIEDAYNYASKRSAIIITAAGNQGNIGYTSLLNNDWVTPVSACNDYGYPTEISNYGPSIGKRGLMAPGVNVRSTLPGGRYGYMSGTSISAPFVTGTIALLCSLFPGLGAAEAIYTLKSIGMKRESVIPPLLNAEAAFAYISTKYTLKSP